ncbi:hypothetical protein [Vandammella animalimorsus]|uniref:hypothetical protein n=1 Tax=Vandammella animalimorsus TaxID=2029117 RepID=UPI0011C3554A|nr:hypothetical protein [Vandammella animalimorsus]
MKSTYALQHSRKIKIRQESLFKDQPIHSLAYEKSMPAPNISKSNFRQVWGTSSKSFSGHTNRSPLVLLIFCAICIALRHATASFPQKLRSAWRLVATGSGFGIASKWPRWREPMAKLCAVKQ